MLQNNEFRPIFIMGLHRSGTTILYESLAQALEIQGLELYHVLNFEKRANEKLERERLNQRLQELGIKDRGVDGISISDRAHEEYGWLLRYLSGRFTTDSQNVHFIEEICRRALPPGEMEILLKSPWDSGSADVLSRAFPKARFVFIHRPNHEIIRSQLRNALFFASEPQPYLSLLLRPIPKGERYLTLHRLGLKILGRRLFKWTLTRVFSRTVAAEKRKLEASYRSLPNDVKTETSYAAFVSDRDSEIRRIAKFIGKEVKNSHALPRVETRPAGEFSAQT